MGVGNQFSLEFVKFVMFIICYLSGEIELLLLVEDYIVIRDIIYVFSYLIGIYLF